MAPKMESLRTGWESWGDNERDVEDKSQSVTGAVRHVVVESNGSDSGGCLKPRRKHCASFPWARATQSVDGDLLKLMKMRWLVPFARYFEFWGQARKLLCPSFRPGALMAYRPMLQTKMRTLLTRPLASPDEWETHIERLVPARRVYEVKERHNPKLDAARQLAKLASEFSLPGALLVNELPFQWLSWFSYQPRARFGHNGKDVVLEPMRFVKESLNGTAQPSLALECLRQTEKLGHTEHENAEEVIAGTLGSMYSAGTDTTRAQRELDAVTGRERLPSLEDRPRLPFNEAMCKEVLRRRPIAPLSLTGRRRVLHDPAVYPEPGAFKPEQFLDKEGNLRDDLGTADVSALGGTWRK
ncbi:cytochrome P450 [Lactarius pseudohatsudake]|nr:cytochrome P450 [Lactarius pseudohatsudake]